MKRRQEKRNRKKYREPEEKKLPEVTCPYCGNPAHLVDSSTVYGGQTFGNIWLCSKYPYCNSYVGVHKTGRLKNHPLGNLADPTLRFWKKRTHEIFDPLWIGKGKGKRIEAYKWLGKVMKIDAKQCHIGLFSEEQCREAITHIQKLKNGLEETVINSEAEETGSV